MSYEERESEEFYGDTVAEIRASIYDPTDALIVGFMIIEVALVLLAMLIQNQLRLSFPLFYIALIPVLPGLFLIWLMMRKVHDGNLMDALIMSLEFLKLDITPKKASLNVYADRVETDYRLT